MENEESREHWYNQDIDKKNEIEIEIEIEIEE